MNNGINGFGNGSNSDDSTRDLNKILEGVMGTSNSNGSNGNVEQSGLGSNFGMQYQGPRSVADQNPAVAPNNNVEQPVQPETSPQVAPEPVIENPVQNQNSMNPFLSKMDSSVSTPAPQEQPTPQPMMDQSTSTSANASVGYTGVNPQPNIYDNSAIQQPNMSNMNNMNNQSNLYGGASNQANPYAGTTIPEAGALGTQNFTPEQNNIGVQTPQTDMYTNNLGLNSTNDVNPSSFNQNDQVTAGVSDPIGNNLNNTYSNQNFNNNYGNDLNNNTFDSNQNFIQEPNSLNNQNAQTGDSIAPKKKFPLSLRELILIGVAIAGVVTVIIMYS